MFIKKMQFKNYKSCLDTTFKLDPNLSVLIGPNSSGKTNVLTAMLLLHKLLQERHFPQEEADDQYTVQCKIKVWFDLNGKEIIFSAGLNTYVAEENRDVIVSSKQRWYLKDITGDSKWITVPLWVLLEMKSRSGLQIRWPIHFLRRSKKTTEADVKIFNKAFGPLSYVAEYISGMKYYSASQFTNPSRCPISFEIEVGRKRSRGSGRSPMRFLSDLYNQSKDKDKSKYNDYFEVIGPSGMRLVDDIIFKEITTSSTEVSVRSGGKIHKRKLKKILVVPKFKIDKHKLSPNQLSEGTFKTIALLFYLMTEIGSILLIEEPEVCIHHGLLSSIIELIKSYSRGKQIIVSTHSDFVLDKVNVESVYKVTKKANEGTKVSHLTKSMTKKELAALRHYLNNEGNLGEYWRQGALDTSYGNWNNSRRV